MGSACFQILSSSSKKCSSVVICMATSEHLHFRQVCVALEITVKQINQYSSESLDYSSAHPVQGSALVLLHTPFHLNWQKSLKYAEQFVDA